MNPHAVLRRAARIEYAVLRPPLGWLDERVVARFLDEDSAARQTFGTLLDVVDDAARRWLADPRDRARGYAAEQPAADETDETDETVTEEPVTDQPVTDEPVTDEPPAPVASIVDEQVEDLTEELLEEEETETFVGELAEQDDLRRVQAELDAKRLLAEQQEHQAQLGHPDGDRS